MQTQPANPTPAPFDSGCIQLMGGTATGALRIAGRYQDFVTLEDRHGNDAGHYQRSSIDARYWSVTNHAFDADGNAWESRRRAVQDDFGFLAEVAA